MRNERLQRLLRVLQWISLTFLLVLGTLMAHDALRGERVLSGAKQQLDALKVGNLDDPALARTVRDLDYLYRASYFQGQDRQRFGFLLLGAGFFVLGLLVVLERYRFPPQLKIPAATRPTTEKERKELFVYTAAGIGILVVLLVALRIAVTGQADAEGVRAGQDDTAITAAAQPPNPAIPLPQALEAAAGQWPQFRGSLLPNRNPLPAHWNFKTKWSAKIPLPGFNSPVVWEDKIFVAGGDKKERAVFCYDAAAGTLLWKTSSTNSPAYPDITDDTGVSAPTLCVDQFRVYAIFATGEMLCCDHDGKTVWQRQLPTPGITYGYASSPLLLGDRLIVQYDLQESQTLYAMDVLTGKDLWKAQRQTSSSWSSPYAYIKDGTILLFAAGMQAAEGIDGLTGRVLWKYEDMGGEVATSAVVYRDAFYFSNAGAITGAFRAEDGKVLFRNDNVPAPDVASPVVAGGAFLLFSSGGTVIGLNPENGEELFEHNFDTGFYASPVVLQNKIVAVNLAGELLLLSPGAKTLNVEGSFATGTKIVSVPAFHRGNVILRTADNRLLYMESAP